MPLFEIADGQQQTPVEVGERDGQPVLRLRRGVEITDKLVGELNELTGDRPGRGWVTDHRPPVVVVVVR